MPSTRPGQSPSAAAPRRSSSAVDTPGICQTLTSSNIPPPCPEIRSKRLYGCGSDCGSPGSYRVRALRDAFGNDQARMERVSGVSTQLQLQTVGHLGRNIQHARGDDGQTNSRFLEHSDLVVRLEACHENASVPEAASPAGGSSLTVRWWDSTARSGSVLPATESSAVIMGGTTAVAAARLR
jgi:hypothetical protein